MRTVILLVRHGETDWNAVHRLQGHLDVQLNDKGRAQARALGRRVREEGWLTTTEDDDDDAPTSIYSSDLTRATSTLSIILSECGIEPHLHPASYRLEPRLREMNLGIFQGLTWRECSERFAHEFRCFQRDSSFRVPGGGESLDDLDRRVLESMEEIARRHRGRRVLIVTHGGVIDSVNRVCLKSTRHEKAKNVCVHEVHALFHGDDEESARLEWKLGHRVNDDSHLSIAAEACDDVLSTSL